MAQINKEEELFKWEPTTYPQIEAILTSLEPYQKLFTTVYKWQKAEKRIMDGAFLELNAEKTQAEVLHVHVHVYASYCACTMYTCVHVHTCEFIMYM